MCSHSLHLTVESMTARALLPIFPERTSWRVSVLHIGHSTITDVGTLISRGQCAHATYFFLTTGNGPSWPGITISAHPSTISMLFKARFLSKATNGGTWVSK